MPCKIVKAGPVATGTDPRNIDLATYSENSPSHRDLQVWRLRRLYAVTFETAATIAGLAFAVSR